jgi:TolA-binding protein
LTACPSKVEDLLQDGHRAARANEWDRARASYGAVTQADPQSAHALALEGYALVKLGLAIEAKAAWQKALTLDSGEVTARAGLAQQALESADAGAALAIVDEDRRPVLTLRLVRARALLLRGASGDAELAAQEASAALEADATSLQASYLLGSAQLSLAHYAEAQATFEALAKRAADHPFGPYGLARLAAAQRRSTDVALYLKAARAAAKGSWNAQAVAADPAFAFLSGSPVLQDLLAP